MADRREHHQSWVTAFSSDVRTPNALLAGGQQRRLRQRSFDWTSAGLVPAAHRAVTAGLRELRANNPAKPRAAARQPLSRHILSEELFGDFLARERKRADRLDRS